jgi:SAM-dependent methyltransferase
MNERDDIYRHLNLLSEPARVRILRLLEVEELGVGELTSVVQLPQSTVSRHLKALLDRGWIRRRSAGTSSLVRFVVSALPEDARMLWSVVRDEPTDEAGHAQDVQRMRSILEQRRLDSRTFFGRVAADWGGLREALFGCRFTLPTLMGLLDETWRVVDLGCGTGETIVAIAPYVSSVIGVDQEPSMLEAAQRRLHGLDGVTLRQGDVCATGLTGGEADAVLSMLVMHHVPAPADLFVEAHRLLKEGGRFVVLDMLAHDRVEYRASMGHLHLGFDRETIAAAAATARLRLARFQLLDADPDAQGPGLFAATLVRLS